jgi:tRNA(Met) C34 N-acetyltransferase TmcA
LKALKKCNVPITRAAGKQGANIVIAAGGRGDSAAVGVAVQAGEERSP